MLYLLTFEGKKAPVIYVMAESLIKAYIKFYASKFAKNVKGKKLLVIESLSLNHEFIDIHESNKPIIVFYSYSKGQKTKEEDLVFGHCIADNFSQAMKHFSDSNKAFQNIWVLDGGGIVII